MKLNFPGHQLTDRNIDIRKEDLKIIFDAMKEHFMEYLEYSSFYEQNNNQYNHSYEKRIVDVCKKYDVYTFYKEDRLAFFKAVLNQIENPYEEY